MDSRGHVGSGRMRQRAEPGALAPSPLPRMCPAAHGSPRGTTARQIVEVRNDSLMKRTHRRPLPAGAISRHHAIAFAVCAGLSGVAILYTKVRALTQRFHAVMDSRPARRRRVAGQPHNSCARGCQHRVVRRRVHPAEADQRREHLGGRRGGRHPAAHGLGRRCRQAGARRRGALRPAVLLADAALHGARVLVSHRLRGWRVRAHHACDWLGMLLTAALAGIACYPSSTPLAGAPLRWLCATRCTWCRWGLRRAPWASPLLPLRGRLLPCPPALQGALPPSTPAARKHQPEDCFCSAWCIFPRFSWHAWCIACRTRQLRAQRRRQAWRSGAPGFNWALQRARSSTTPTSRGGRARQRSRFPCRCRACRSRAPREPSAPKTNRRRRLQRRQSRGARREQLASFDEYFAS